MTTYNQYDALTPKGREPRGEERRLRVAVPGSSLDAVFASRYHLLGVVDDGGTLIAVEAVDGGEGETPEQTAQVDAAIRDETPPDARRRNRN